MNADRLQQIKEQVEDWGANDLKELNDIVVVELESDEDLQAYKDECDRQGYIVEEASSTGPNGRKQIEVSNDPDEFRRKHPL